MSENVTISKDFAKRLLGYVNYVYHDQAGNFGNNPVPYAIMERDSDVLDKLVGNETPTTRIYDKKSWNDSVDEFIEQIMDTDIDKEECRKYIEIMDPSDVDGWMKGYDNENKKIVTYSVSFLQEYMLGDSYEKKCESHD